MTHGPDVGSIGPEKNSKNITQTVDLLIEISSNTSPFVEGWQFIAEDNPSLDSSLVNGGHANDASRASIP